MGNRKIMRAVAFAALLCLAASTVSFPTDSQNVVTSLDVGEADGVVACTSPNCNGDGGSGSSDSGGRSYSSSSAGGKPYSSSGGDSYSSSRGNSSVAELGANLELSQTASKRKPAAEGPPQEAAPKKGSKREEEREKKERQERKFPGSTSKDKFKNGQGQWQHGDTPNSKKNPYHKDEANPSGPRHKPGTNPNDELGTSRGPPRGARHAAKKKAAKKKKQKQIRKKEKAKKAPKKAQGKKAGKP